MTYRLLDDEDGVEVQPAAAAAAAASVILLHGLGADGHDFVSIVPQLELPAGRAVRFLFPHAPMRPVALNQGLRMRAWYDIVQLSIDAPEDAAGMVRSAERIAGYIARENERGVSSHRIVLAGFSQGGALALYAGLRHTSKLGGVLALSTYLALRGRIAQEASEANRTTPILMCHGHYDPVLPFPIGCASRDELRRLGHPVEWKAYDMQHEVCGAEIRDIARWLRGLLA